MAEKNKYFCPSAGFEGTTIELRPPSRPAAAIHDSFVGGNAYLANTDSGHSCALSSEISANDTSTACPTIVWHGMRHSNNAAAGRVRE